MSTLKQLEQLSAWLDYELDTTLLVPPVLRVRLRATDAFDVTDSFGALDVPAFGSSLLKQALHAIADVDLTLVSGERVVLTDENKEAVLRPLLTERVKERKSMLAVIIVADSKKRELFLKN